VQNYFYILLDLEMTSPQKVPQFNLKFINPKKVSILTAY